MNKQEYISDMLNRTSMFIDDSSMNKIQNTTFAISGLGGVGAITAELLARWGVKKFRLLDMDKYEATNLNRQLFATSKTLGKYKVDVAAERIMEINPYAEIEIKIPERVSNSNIDKFSDGAGIMIQNADYPSCKLFYLAAQKRKIPLVNGYASITGGRVQSFDYRYSECESLLEKIWKKFKYKDIKPITEMNDEEIVNFDKNFVHNPSASLNFVTNMVGCLIVSETIKLITGEGSVVNYPKYLSFDSFNYNMQIKNSNSLFNQDTYKKILEYIKN